jgi:hypothetical protein
MLNSEKLWILSWVKFTGCALIYSVWTGTCSGWEALVFDFHTSNPPWPAGATGATGPQWATGATGAMWIQWLQGVQWIQWNDGYSAYQLAQINGFTWDELSWLASLIWPRWATWTISLDLSQTWSINIANTVTVDSTQSWTMNASGVYIPFIVDQAGNKYLDWWWMLALLAWTLWILAMMILVWKYLLRPLLKNIF